MSDRFWDDKRGTGGRNVMPLRSITTAAQCRIVTSRNAHEKELSHTRPIIQERTKGMTE